MEKTNSSKVENIMTSNEDPEDYNTGEVSFNNDGGYLIFQGKSYKDFRNLSNTNPDSLLDWTIPRMKQMISDIQSLMSEMLFIYDSEIMDGTDLMSSQRYIDYLNETIKELEEN